MPATTLSYTLEATPTGTRVVVRHTGFGEHHESCRSHGFGWEHVLNWLTGFIQAPAIKSERGFRYEILPMINTVLPQ